MHSITTRLNSIFFYSIAAILALSSVNILSTLFNQIEPKINSFEISSEFTLYNNPYTKVQHARSYFSLDADFTEVINWNNNITFIWISAEYSTGSSINKEQRTTVTIYDKIIPRVEKDLHHVILKDQIFEYPLIDHFKSLSNKEVIITLHWEHMPIIGPILKNQKELKRITLPSETNKPHQIVIETEYHYEDLNDYYN